jgi:hypothetical protein
MQVLSPRVRYVRITPLKYFKGTPRIVRTPPTPIHSYARGWIMISEVIKKTRQKN